jgi:hypothetical protein
MKRNLLGKGLVSVVILIFLSLAVQPGIATVLPMEEKILQQEEKESSGQLNKELKKNHIIYLLWGLITTPNNKVKNILKLTIKEIIRDGNATIIEIEDIAEICDADIDIIFILADIKTVGDTHGEVICIPGYLRVCILRRFISKGSFVLYSPSWWGWDWDLCIDGISIPEGRGFIIGYFGITKYFPTDRGGYPPFIEFDGYGILIFHNLK